MSVDKVGEIGEEEDALKANMFSDGEDEWLDFLEHIDDEDERGAIDSEGKGFGEDLDLDNPYYYPCAPEIYMPNDQQLASELAERFRKVEKGLQHSSGREEIDNEELDELWGVDEDLEKDEQTGLEDEFADIGKDDGKNFVLSYEARRKKFPIKKRLEVKSSKQDIATFVFDAIQRIKNVNFKGKLSKLSNFSDDDNVETENDEVDKVSENSDDVEIPEKSGNEADVHEVQYEDVVEEASVKSQDGFIDYELLRPISDDRYITETENSSVEDK